MFTAVFEPRLKAIVSSCGFTTLPQGRHAELDRPALHAADHRRSSATTPKKVPFDFQEIVAAFAPRPFLACAAEKDDDFDVSGRGSSRATRKRAG